MTKYSYIDLKPYLNSAGATYDSDRAKGALNAWGNSFPAEEFPFDSIISVADINFQLGKKEGVYDHVEALGQLIELPVPHTTNGIALLCCGEMGDQELIIRVFEVTGDSYSFSVRAKAWMTSKESNCADGYYFTHLHYPGGYGLNFLRPVLWCSQYKWEQTFSICGLQIDKNPLFHIFAITLLNTQE